ncbi:MAG: hypothetical protein JXR96_17075 [Deltaproteobacteria bacterium]|nr:hypothetical protein [Deltaproteobacteria bacterium]
MLRGIRKMRAIATVVTCAFLFSGCLTRFSHKAEAVPDNARVAVLLADEDGNPVNNTLDMAYVYEALHANGMVPVALNDVASEKILGRDSGDGLFSWTKDKSQAVVSDDPILLTSLQKHLKEHGIDFLLVMHASTSALDEDLRVVMIKVESMKVVGSKFYRYRIMAALWSGLTVALGLSLLVCPWFYLIDGHANNHEMLSDFLSGLRT